MAKRRKNYPVAIVGMHGRFPDAYDVKDFWTNLFEGIDTVGLVPKERWDWKKFFGSSANESISTTVNCAAFMPMVDRFDHRFFGIMPREAEAMDPQQRLFMQTAYAALEDAGYAPGSLVGSNTGVFVGIGNADYPTMMRLDGAAFDIFRATGLALTCVANRVSFSLGIHGPSESIDTACSGSLVAIHRAIQSMQYGECERAIVGGVSLLVGPDLFIAFDKAGMLSKSARSRTFDAGANGYVRGEGVAALVLCPLEQAEKNGDYIYGVIHGSAVNHGGRAHSFTAPNAAAQAQVIKAAWENSGKDFHEACMMETHGTGTPLGDPIEVNGLKKVSEEFGLGKKKASAQAKIALGALKTHVGHMEATAGVGGVIKALLSMKYRTIPKNLNYSVLNPHIELEHTPYYMPTQNIDLSGMSGPLLAGVSSFGFGGVNSHVVIEARDASPEPPDTAETAYLIPLSGKDKNSLHARVWQLIRFLETSLGEDESASHAAVMDALRTSLGIEADATQPIMLASVRISIAQWMWALKALTPLLGRAVEFSEVQDCISLQECVRQIVRNTQVGRLLRGAEQLSLCARVAVPDEEIRAVGLDRIACTLLHGRDHYKERLACIAHSKQELLAMLRAYLAAPDTVHDALWTHSIRAGDSTIEPPAEAGTDNLAAWATWWVGTKSATLSWDTLYPQARKPQKFPLPAYPFQLDRIWYAAAPAMHGREPEAAMEKPAVPTGVIPAPAPLALPAGIAAAWEACMRQSQWIVPSSVASLGYLLDYASHKSRGAPVTLKNAVFGRPCNIEDARLVFGIMSSASEARVIQCCASRQERKVLAQAEMMPDGALATRGLPSIDAATPVPREQFLTQLEGQRLSLGPVLHCIERVHADDHRLQLHIHMPAWSAKDSRFWVPLTASLLAGLAYLHRQRSQPFLLPWTINAIDFRADRAQPAKALYVEVDPGSGLASAMAVGTSGDVLLRLEGIALRESAIVRMPARQAANTDERWRAGAL